MGSAQLRRSGFRYYYHGLCACRATKANGSSKCFLFDRMELIVYSQLYLLRQRRDRIRGCLDSSCQRFEADSPQRSSRLTGLRGGRP